MPQPLSLFGLSPADTQQAMQAQDEQHAIDVAKLTTGQLTNYNGAHVGDMLGRGIASAFGLQDPYQAKAQQLQQIQQATEQQAPWSADPEAHMKLAVSNLMKAGMGQEAGNAYQAYLDWKKQQADSMRETAYSQQVGLAGKKQADQDAADQAFLASMKNGAFAQPQSTPATMPSATQPPQSNAPTGAFDLSSPDNIKALQANIDTLRQRDPAQADQVQQALDDQVKRQAALPTDSAPKNPPFQPPVPYEQIQAASALDSPIAKSWVQAAQKRNADALKQYQFQYPSGSAVYSANNRQQPLVVTIGADGNPVYTTQKDAVGKIAAAKPSASAGQPLSDDAVNLAAARYRIDGTLPALGMGNAVARSQILNAAASQATQEGQTSEASALRQVANKANSGALLQLTKQEQLVSAFEKNAVKNADLALGLSQNVNRLGVPVVDRWIQAGRKSVGGDVDVAKFHAANETFINEYAKIMSGSMGNTPVSDQARSYAHDLLDKAFTKDQYVGVVNTLKQEMNNRIQGFAEQKQQLMGMVNSPSQLTAPAINQPAQAAPQQPKAVNWGDLH